MRLPIAIDDTTIAIEIRRAAPPGIARACSPFPDTGAAETISTPVRLSGVKPAKLRDIGWLRPNATTWLQDIPRCRRHRTTSPVARSRGAPRHRRQGARALVGANALTPATASARVTLGRQRLTRRLPRSSAHWRVGPRGGRCASISGHFTSAFAAPSPVSREIRRTSSRSQAAFLGDCRQLRFRLGRAAHVNDRDGRFRRLPMRSLRAFREGVAGEGDRENQDQNSRLHVGFLSKPEIARAVPAAPLASARAARGAFGHGPSILSTRCQR